MNSNNYQAVVVCDQQGMHIYRHEDIVCLRAMGSYTDFNIQLNKKSITKVTGSRGLGFYEKQLSNEFIRLGRSIILNLKHVQSVMVDRRVVFTIPNGPDVVLDKAAYGQFKRIMSGSSDQNPHS